MALCPPIINSNTYMNINKNNKVLHKLHLKTIYVFFLTCVLFIVPSPAILSADDIIPITEKVRPIFDAPWKHVGGFYMNPQLTIGTIYNDNIYAREDNAKSDFINIITPQVVMQSIWSRHSLNLDAGINAGFYARESDENYYDGHFNVKGMFEAMPRRLDFKASAGISRRHEERGDPNSEAGLKEPVVYYSYEGSVSSELKIYASALDVGMNIKKLNYNDVDFRQGGTLDMSIRNRTLYEVFAQFLTVRYYIAIPSFIAYYEWGRYDKSEARRDFQGYRFGIAAKSGFSSFILGTLFLGYAHREYEDRENISGVLYKLDILWNPTALMSVKVYSGSDLDETNIEDSSGVYGIISGISVDHLLLRNLLVGAFFEYSRNFYKGLDYSSQLVSFGPSITYLWNRYLDAKLVYKRVKKIASVTGNNYAINIFILTLNGKF